LFFPNKVCWRLNLNPKPGLEIHDLKVLGFEGEASSTHYLIPSSKDCLWQGCFTLIESRNWEKFPFFEVSNKNQVVCRVTYWRELWQMYKRELPGIWKCFQVVPWDFYCDPPS
jgi:hypothetical protein